MGADICHVNSYAALGLCSAERDGAGLPAPSSAPTSYRPGCRNTLGRKLFSDGLRTPALAVQLDYSHDDLGWYPTWTAELHPARRARASPSRVR
jgi:hypothetical protein